MVLESLEMSVVIPASPDRIYKAWLDGQQHAAFTGGGEAFVEPIVGGSHSAWDGYISGRNLHLEPNRRIVQSWRSTDFPSGHADSKIEVLLEQVAGGTKLLLRHDDIPEGQAKSLEQGWKEFYFEPMTEYFGEAEAEGDDDAEGEEDDGDDLSRSPAAVVEAAVEEAVEEIMEEAAEQVRALAVEPTLPAHPALTRKPARKKVAAKAAARPAKRKAKAGGKAKMKMKMKMKAKAKGARKPAKKAKPAKRVARKPTKKATAKARGKVKGKRGRR